MQLVYIRELILKRASPAVLQGAGCLGSSVELQSRRAGEQLIELVADGDR